MVDVQFSANSHFPFAVDRWAQFEFCSFFQKCVDDWPDFYSIALERDVLVALEFIALFHGVIGSRS